MKLQLQLQLQLQLGMRNEKLGMDVLFFIKISSFISNFSFLIPNSKKSVLL